MSSGLSFGGKRQVLSNHRSLFYIFWLLLLIYGTDLISNKARDIDLTKVFKNLKRDDDETESENVKRDDDEIESENIKRDDDETESENIKRDDDEIEWA